MEQPPSWILTQVTRPCSAASDPQHAEPTSLELKSTAPVAASRPSSPEPDYEYHTPITREPTPPPPQTPSDWTPSPPPSPPLSFAQELTYALNKYINLVDMEERKGRKKKVLLMVSSPLLRTTISRC